LSQLLQFYPPVIAHRGASASAPENTMSAFIKAALLGIKWIECDVMQSSDKKLLIHHDETLERTTNGKGLLIDHSYAYLRTLDAGRRFSPQFSGEKIPSFIELMDFLYKYKLSANIELKAYPGQEESLVKKVISEATPFLESEDISIIFSSFSVKSMYFLRKYAPTSMLGLLLHEWEPHWEESCHALDCTTIHVNQGILTQEKAKKIKAMGKFLLSYTVNDPTRAKQLYHWGVDAVFSDAPEKIVECLGSTN